MKRSLLITLAVAASLAPLNSNAASYTYSRTTTNTTPGETWSTGTNWTATPFSASDTSLVFSGTLAAGVNIFSNNDIAGNFQLNSLSLNETGPGSGTVPTVTVNGNALQFVNDGLTGPSLNFSNGGGSRPTILINNNLVLTNDLTVVVNNNNSATLGGTISGPGALLKNTSGSSTLTLTGNNTFTGGVTIGLGQISVATIGNQNATSSNLGGAYSTINFGAGGNTGTLTYTGAGETTDRIINLVDTTGGASLSAGGTGALVFSSNVTATGSGDKSLTLTGASTASLINTLSGTISNSTGGATSVVKANGSSWALTNTASSFTGGLEIQRGLLQISTVSTTGNNSSIGAGGQILVNTSGSGAAELRIVGNGGTTDRAITVQNSTLNNVNGITLNSSGTGGVNFTGGLSMLNASTSLAINVVLRGTSAFTNTLSGGITNSLDGLKTVNVQKTDTQSTWVLSGASNYTGSTTVSNGTLAGIGANAFGNTSGISIAAVGILSLRGDASTSFVRPANSAGYAVTTSASGATINADQATVGGTAAKTMTIGTVGTTSTAATYTLNLTGANNTSLSLGAVTGSASTASATVTIANAIAGGGSLTLASYTSANTAVGENLTFNGVGNTTVSGAITPSTTPLRVTQSGSGTTTFNGTNAYTGTTTISAGTLLVNGAHTSAGAFSVSAGGTLGGLGSITTASNAGITFANGASLSPGDNSASNFTAVLGTGTFDISAMATNSRLLFTLGTSSDKLTLTSGTLSIGTLNSGEFAFTLGSGFGAGTYTLFDTNSTITATSLDTASFALNGSFNGSLQFANSNQDIQLLVSAVPEPSTWSAVLCGLGILVLLQRTRRRNREC